MLTPRTGSVYSAHPDRPSTTDPGGRIRTTGPSQARGAAAAASVTDTDARRFWLLIIALAATLTALSAAIPARARFPARGGRAREAVIVLGLEAECSADGEPPDLPVHAQAELLRICREALNNARKHADATLVRVRVRSDTEQMTLSVSDDGAGFDPTPTPRRSGFGMRSMRERAQALGAQLEVRSAPMEGTSVTLTLSLTASPE